MGDISWRITAPCPVNPVFLTGNPVGIPRAVIPVVLLIHPLRPSSAFHMAWLALLPASSVRAGTRSGVRVSVVEGVRLLRPGRCLPVLRFSGMWCYVNVLRWSAGRIEPVR